MSSNGLWIDTPTSIGFHREGGDVSTGHAATDESDLADIVESPAAVHIGNLDEYVVLTGTVEHLRGVFEAALLVLDGAPA